MTNKSLVTIEMGIVHFLNMEKFYERHAFLPFLWFYFHIIVYRGPTCFCPKPFGVAKIAFSSDRDGNWEIYLMNSNGSGQINLTHHPRSDLMPAFSPTGAQILFVSTRDEGRDLYLMDPNGANVRRVFKEKAWRQSPAWSPDGKWIAYQKENSNDARTIHCIDR